MMQEAPLPNRTLGTLSFAATALLAFGGAALADVPGQGAYVGAALTPAEFKIDDFHPADDGSIVRVPSYTLRGLMVIGGYRFTNHFAIEGRAGTFSSETREWRLENNGSTELVPVHVGIDASMSVYAKGMLPLYEGRVNVYGMAGHTRLRFSERTPIESRKSLTANGWDGTNAFAAGVEIYATPQWGVNIELNRLYRRSTESLTTTQIGALYRF